MSEFPQCPNHVKKRGCTRSDIFLLNESSDHWTFRCRTCELIWVVSRPAQAARSKFRVAEERLRKKTEERRRREGRPVYFT